MKSYLSVPLYCTWCSSRCPAFFHSFLIMAGHTVTFGYHQLTKWTAHSIRHRFSLLWGYIFNCTLLQGVCVEILHKRRWLQSRRRGEKLTQQTRKKRKKKEMENSDERKFSLRESMEDDIACAASFSPIFSFAFYSIRLLFLFLFSLRT